MKFINSFIITLNKISIYTNVAESISECAAPKIISKLKTKIIVVILITANEALIENCYSF